MNHSGFYGLKTYNSGRARAAHQSAPVTLSAQVQEGYTLRLFLDHQ